MWGSIQTRIAALALALALLSTMASCFVIATHAQDAMEAAVRDRLVHMAEYLRDAAGDEAAQAPAWYGPPELQLLLEAAIERDEELRLAAVVGRDGTILYSADRGETEAAQQELDFAGWPPPETPEVRLIGGDLVARVGLPPGGSGPVAEILLAVPQDRLAPQVERLITVMLSGGLAIMAGLVPLAFLGTALILLPLRRSLRVLAVALQALGHGLLPPLPRGAELLRGRGDPLWDAPDAAENAAATLTIVDSFARARAAHAAATDRLARLERRIARLDTGGAAALETGEAEAVPPPVRGPAGTEPAGFTRAGPGTA